MSPPTTSHLPTLLESPTSDLRPTKGFTLVELIIVILIISIFVLLMIPAYKGIERRLMLSHLENTLVQHIEKSDNTALSGTISPSSTQTEVYVLAFVPGNEFYYTGLIPYLSGEDKRALINRPLSIQTENPPTLSDETGTSVALTAFPYHQSFPYTLKSMKLDETTRSEPVFLYTPPLSTKRHIQGEQILPKTLDLEISPKDDDSTFTISLPLHQ